MPGSSGQRALDTKRRSGFASASSSSTATPPPSYVSGIHFLPLAPLTCGEVDPERRGLLGESDRGRGGRDGRRRRAQRRHSRPGGSRARDPRTLATTDGRLTAGESSRDPREAICRPAATDCIHLEARRLSSTGTWASPSRGRLSPLFSGQPVGARSASLPAAPWRGPRPSAHRGARDGLADDGPAHPVRARLPCGHGGARRPCGRAARRTRATFRPRRRTVLRTIPTNAPAGHGLPNSAAGDRPLCDTPGSAYSAHDPPHLPSRDPFSHRHRWYSLLRVQGGQTRWSGAAHRGRFGVSSGRSSSGGTSSRRPLRTNHRGFAHEIHDRRSHPMFHDLARGRGPPDRRRRNCDTVTVNRYPNARDW